MNRAEPGSPKAAPAETHLSIVATVLGGVVDRVPDSLRVCVAHGGGSFAFWLGRVENAWHRRNDSVVFAEPALRLLVDTLGVGQVMTGSDCSCAATPNAGSGCSRPRRVSR